MGARKTDSPKNSWLGHELLQRSSEDREALCAPLVAGFLWPRRAGDPPFRDAPEPPHVTIRDVPGEFVDRVEKLFEQMVPYHDRAVETIRHHPDRAALTTDDLVAGMGAPATDPELSDLLYGLGLYLLAKLRYCTPRPRGAGQVKQLRALCAPIGEHCRVTEDGVRFPMIGTIPLKFPNESPRELYAVILWARWAERKFQVVPQLQGRSTCRPSITSPDPRRTGRVSGRRLTQVSGKVRLPLVRPGCSRAGWAAGPCRLPVTAARVPEPSETS